MVVLFNINTYAAVGANDSSAFVTMAEFDEFVESFIDKMDEYEFNLVPRIDSAVAAYIDGLTNKTTKTVAPLIPDEKGIWSVTRDTDSGPKNWVEGTIKMTYVGHIARMTSNRLEEQGALKLTCTGTSQTLFYEHLIDEYNISGNYVGEYRGYNKSYISCEAYGGDTSSSGAFTGYFMKGGGIKLEKCYWTTGGAVKGIFMVSPVRIEREGHWSNVDGGACIREINETMTSNVILAGQSWRFPYFNLYKTSGTNALWCQDSEYGSNNLHTKNPSLGKVFSTVSASGYYYLSDGGTKKKYDFSESASNMTWNASSTGRVACKPFLGFTTNVTNWNQIYTRSADDIIDDLESVAGADTVTVNSKKHLMITNGWPIIKAEKGAVITMPVKFGKIGSSYKNIDIWLKASAFKKNEDVKTTTDKDIIKAENVDKMKASTFSNAITLDAVNGKGEGVLKFTMPKDGYVFMKWSVAGNNAYGGGVFYPQAMTVVVDKDKK